MISVTVIVPCYNEQATIHQLLEAIVGQTFPINEIEVIIADGLSTDNTRKEINSFQMNHPDLGIRIIDNIHRNIPSGLNRAIEIANGQYIVRMDAHSIPSPDYIQKCINGLAEGLGDNVGGIWQIKPGSNTWIAQSIALAASHPIGAGDALYRIGGVAQEVDTVPFGAFKRELVNRIGMFDETLLTNEDYEFNTRIKQSGGKVWMDPSIKSIYHTRQTIRELAKQYWRYGYWKAQMLQKYPRTLRYRQILPPLFVLSLISLGILSTVWMVARLLLAIIVILYILVIFAVGVQLGIKHKSLMLIIGVVIALTTIHLSWGSAFLWGLLAKPKVNEPQE